MSKPKSVKVRIAVAVDARGNVGICAVYPRVANVNVATTEALYDLHDHNDGDGQPTAVYLVTVDAPLPPPPKTLPAKVTKVKRSAHR